MYDGKMRSLTGITIALWSRYKHQEQHISQPVTQELKVLHARAIYESQANHQPQS